MSEAIDIATEDNTPVLRLAEQQLADLQGERDPIVEAATQLAVCDQPSLELAGFLLTDRIKPMLKEIDKSCGPVVKSAHEAHKAAKKQENDLKAPLLEAQTIVNGKVETYLDEQERLRIAEEARIAEEQRKQEAEQRRLQAAADAENRRREKEEEDERIAHAAALEEEGKTYEAEQVLETPAPVRQVVVTPPAPPPIPRAAPARAQGVSRRKTWKGEVVNLKQLVEAVAAGKVPLNVLKVDDTKLNQHIRSLDGQVQYPGVRVFEQGSISSRASR